MVSGRTVAVSAPYPGAAPADQGEHPNFVGGVIPYQAEIGEGTVLGYQGLGIVIHKQSKIGKHCTICQHVTLGGDGGPEGGLPVLGDYVYLGANTVILGHVHIGNHVDIGANSVVLQDLPDNCVAVGAPARIVRIKE